MKIEFTKNEFDTLKATAEANYKTFEPVRCPYLNEEVAFNVQGLNHIRTKRWNHGRPEKDQFMRLKLLYLAPEIIKTSRTLQGVKSGNRMERIKISSRWETKMVHVTYYEFISVQETNGGGVCRLRIVVKKTGDSPPCFWSIIPYWRQGIHGKEMFEGDPEED